MLDNFITFSLRETPALNPAAVPYRLLKQGKHFAGIVYKVIYQFNQFTVDSGRYLLLQMGKSVSIDPLVFNLLVYLIENRDRVVTRIELLDNLWKGKVVTDAALAARLRDARKVIQDSGSRQEVIKTFHGRGYQFIAAVTGIPANQAQEVSTEPKIASNDSSTQEIPAIAVLPFTNMSGDATQECFVDGMTDETVSYTHLTLPTKRIVYV